MPSRRALLLSSPLLAWPWRSATADAARTVQWHAPVELARGAGVRGPWRQNDSRYDFVDDPAVVLAGDASMVVAWVDQARKSVFVQRRGAGGQAAARPAEVAGAPHAFSWIPRLAIAPDAPERVLLLWQEIIFSGGSHGGDMMLARSEDGGRTFAAPLNLSSSRGGDGKGRITPEYWHNGSYDLVAAPEGRVFAAWTEYDGPLWVARSTDAGRTFSRPARVAGAGGERPARAPALALAKDGALLVAWTEGDHPLADLRLARSADGGATFDAAGVLGEPGYSDAPRLAPDREGVMHLVWAESEGGPFRRQRVLHARSRDGGRKWEAPRAIFADLPAPYASAGFPTLALDGRGGVFILAELMEAPAQRPRALGLAVSTDGGASFTEPAVVPHSADPRGGTNGSSQGLLVRKLAVHGNRIAVVNSSLREGSHSRVWLITGDLRR